MTGPNTKLKSSMMGWEKERLVRDRYALLAKVGRQKKRASQFGKEAEFWATNVTELLAVLGAAVERLRELAPQDDQPTADIVSEHIRLARRLLAYWPTNTESQDRVLTLLASDGLATVTELTREGYVILSSDRILDSVARIIEATKAENPRLSSDSTTETMPSEVVGTSGDVSPAH